ncbi:hypothetical protein DICA2_C09010 [Diutina catenulata]
MRRKKANKCCSCRQLKISCDGQRPTCEYCASTGRHCEYELPDSGQHARDPARSSSETPSDSSVYSIACRATDFVQPELSLQPFHGFTNVSMQMNLTPLQARLLKFMDDWVSCNFSQSRDERSLTILFQLVPKHFNESEVVRQGLLTQSGVLMVQSYDYHLLQNAEFTGDSTRAMLKYDPNLVAAYHYSLHGFSVQIQELSRLLDRLRNGTITMGQTVQLLLGSILLILTCCCWSPSPMPLVNFTERKHDFLNTRLGVRATFLLAERLLQADSLYSKIFDSSIMIQPPVIVQWVPLFYNVLISLDCLETPLSPEARELVTGTLGRFSNSVIDCATMSTSVPLIQAASVMDSDFVAMVYEQDVIALQILYLWSCFTLLATSYYHRDTNMFADYMRWYKNHCLSRFGQWRFPWDASVYSVVIVKKYQPDWSSLPSFDPEEVDEMLI